GAGRDPDRGKQGNGCDRLNRQVQDAVGGEGREKRVDESAGQYPGKPASVIREGERAAFKVGQVTKESQVEPWIEVAHPGKERIILTPQDEHWKQENRQHIGPRPRRVRRGRFGDGHSFGLALQTRHERRGDLTRYSPGPYRCRG